MRPWLLLLAVLPTFAGCHTHAYLRDNTIQTTATLSDLNYQQVLNNIALFTAHPGSMPSVAVVNSGTVTVSDVAAINANANYAPTLTFRQQGGGALPILTLLLNPSANRNLTENWTLLPVTDIDNLRRIRCAFQYLVLQGDEASGCEKCRESLRQFYLGEFETLDCLIPHGWYRVGCAKDVPKKACYVGHYCDTYVWVMPDGIEGLARTTMTVIDLATGKPHAPIKTVVRTFKSDGTLDNRQETTTEIDQSALERLKKDQRQERPRRIDAGPAVAPG